MAAAFAAGRVLVDSGTDAAESVIASVEVDDALCLAAEDDARSLGAPFATLALLADVLE